MNLNRTQRIIARVAAILVFLIQAAGIVQNGLDESRGWVWAFLVSATLLILSFHGPDESRTTQESPPKQDKTRLKEAVKDFKVLLSLALEAVNECTVMADKIFAFVRREQLYHKTGPLAQILDPDVHSMLTAHALVVACLAERRQAEDPLVWSTYRTTLIIRLAERHANASVEMAQHSGLPEFKKLTELDAKATFLPIVQGEIEIWENIARKSHDADEDVRHETLLRHVVATFGGRKDETDDQRFIPILTELAEHARTKVVPLLLKGA